MKTLILIVVAIVAVAVQTPAQCNLTVTDSPAVRGLKLGMTEPEVVSLFGKPRMAVYRAERELAYNPSMQSVAGLDGIEYVKLNLVNGRISNIFVQYNLSTKWDSVNEFGSVIATKLSLPSSAWKFGDSLDDKAEMNCGEFTVKVSSRLGGSLELTDLTAYKKKADDEEMKNFEKKKAFKP